MRKFLTKTGDFLGKMPALLRPLTLPVLLVTIAATVGESQTPHSEAPGPVPVGTSAFPRLPAGDSLITPAAEALSRVGAAGEMIGFSDSDGRGTQTITLVHAGKSWMAVYHIDRSGKIRLVSSRPIDADFSLQLNATAPLPAQIREMNHR